MLVLLKGLLNIAGLQYAASRSARLPRRKQKHALTVRQLVEAVVRASRGLPGMENCLVRALALQALLRRYRHAGQLRLGVRRHPDGVFCAHAWVEHEGQVLIGHVPALAHYEPLSGDEKHTLLTIT